MTRPHSISSAICDRNTEKDDDERILKVTDGTNEFRSEVQTRHDAVKLGSSSKTHFSGISASDEDCVQYAESEDMECGEEGEEEPIDDDETEVQHDNEDEPSPFARYRKIVIGIILLTVILFVIIDSTIGDMRIHEGITIFLDWIRENPGTGVVCFVLVFFLASLICVPGALLTLGAGYVFCASFDGSIRKGVLMGTFAVFMGAVTSSTAAFLLSRYLLYDRVRSLSQRYSIFEALDVALSEKGFRIMCLLRLSPITPYVLLNYIAGVTTVKFSSYSLSIFCILPGVVMYAFLGATAGSLTDKSDNSAVTISAIVAGAILGILAIAMTSYYARKELDKEVDLVRARLYARTTSRRRRIRYRQNMQRRKRSRYRRSIDRIRMSAPTMS